MMGSVEDVVAFPTVAEVTLPDAVLADEKHAGLQGPMSVRLWLRMLSCTTVIEKRLRRRFVDQYATTLPRFDALAALDRRPEGMAMGELSHQLLVSNGNTTAIVRQLQSEGHLTIEPAEHDGRSLIVRRTDKGAAHFVDLAEAHHRWIVDMMAGVPEDVQQALFGLLAIVKTSISADPAA